MSSGIGDYSKSKATVTAHESRSKGMDRIDSWRTGWSDPRACQGTAVHVAGSSILVRAYATAQPTHLNLNLKLAPLKLLADPSTSVRNPDEATGIF